MRERMTVPDAAAATWLVRPRMQALVVALIDRDCTMADLAAGSGMSYSLLSHHLRRLVAWGLVRVVGEVARRGRASRLYRATAQSFFIPAAWCPALPGDQLAGELRLALQRRQAAKGVLLHSQDGPRMQLLLDGPGPDCLELWMRLRLPYPQAQQFQGELRALFDRWRGLESAQGASYLVHGALARVD